MTSIISSDIRSDISLSSSLFKGRAGSSGPAVDRLTAAKRVTQLSAVIGNGAHDSSLQINGHVTDKINNNNVNCKYLIIAWPSDVIQAFANTGVAPLLPATIPAKPRLPASVKRSPHFNTVGPTQIASLRKEKQNITVLFKATGRSATFCVIFPPSVHDNFISLEIVTRLGLVTHFNTAAASSITWGSKRLCSTGDFVDLSFSMPGSPKCIARRFYVLAVCPFDMLLTTGAIDPLLN